MQIVLATQSPVLLSEFDPEQVVTVDQVDGSTKFNRLSADRLIDWLNDYTLGELWQKGTIRGGVNHA
jgi:predicted ATPase